MAGKLTELQRETLAKVAAVPSTVRQVNCGYGAWRIFGASPNAVGKLTSLGLIRLGVNDWYELTEAGRAALVTKGAVTLVLRPVCDGAGGCGMPAGQPHAAGCRWSC